MDINEGKFTQIELICNKTVIYVRCEYIRMGFFLNSQVYLWVCWGIFKAHSKELWELWINKLYFSKLRHIFNFCCTQQHFSHHYYRNTYLLSYPLPLFALRYMLYDIEMLFSYFHMLYALSQIMVIFTLRHQPVKS